MKLLHVVQGAPGGIGRVEKLLAAVWEGDPRVEATTLRPTTRVGSSESRVFRAQRARARFRWGLSILFAIVRSRPDVTMLNHLNLTPFAIVLRLIRPRGRLVVWAYGVEAWERPTRWQSLGLRLVDEVWSISEYTARRFVAAADFPSDRVVIVPLALTPEREAALQHLAEEGDREGCNVLTVSRLCVRYGQGKGVDHLIEAMASTHDRVRLVIVGDGDDRARLERLAADAGVASRVRFMGQTDDATLISLYQDSKLVALPSTREGFGLVLLEAMTAGKPVVAARAGAVPELVRDGETGILVPYQDRGALAGAICRLVEDPLLASRLGEQGRWRARNDFGFDRFASRVIELLMAVRAA